MFSVYVLFCYRYKNLSLSQLQITLRSGYLKLNTKFFFHGHKSCVLEVCNAHFKKQLKYFIDIQLVRHVICQFYT